MKPTDHLMTELLQPS